MPGPLGSTVHIDTYLSDMSIGFVQADENYVNGKVAPLKSVVKSSDKYPIWDEDDFLRMQTQETSRHEPAPEASYSMSDDTYTVEYWPLKKRILDMDRVDSDVDLDKATTKFLTQQIMMRREYQLLNILFTAANWTTTATGAASGADFVHFSDESSTPFATVKGYMRTVQTLSGGNRPNTIVTGREVDDYLKEHDDTLDKIKHTQKGIADDELMAQAFGVKNYLVSDVIRVTSAEAATTARAAMAADFMWIGYVAPTPGEFEPSALYNFSWNKYDAGGKGGAQIKRWRSEDPEGDWLKAEAAFQIKVTAAGAGCLLTDAAT